MAEDVVLYFGIIDILTNYDFRKRMESNLKAVVNGKAAISAVNPQYYAKRFQDFMKKIFL
jgi:1-phosphatidylinositol-4-phosphate 5-kinase